MEGVPGKLQLTGDGNAMTYDRNPHCIKYYTPKCDAGQGFIDYGQEAVKNLVSMETRIP